ncbi:MAG TPA: dTDP-4-dehydrorhamnose reductase [Thermoanaerobaculia bacterium]
MPDAAVASVETQPALLGSPHPIAGERPRVLITGSSGMLGSDIAPVLAGGGYEVYPRPRSDLDVTDAAEVARAFRELRPQVVVNCAAFTRVDACESDPSAWIVNAEGVENLSRECLRQAARLVQISTDFVFDGEKREPYIETDETSPLSEYGRGKRAGEEAALRSPGALVVRASWLFGRGGWNFIEAILKQANDGKRELTVVDDQRGRPTATTDLSEAVLALLAAGASGVFHFANRGEVTWHDFAQEILLLSGYDDVRVLPTTSAALARPAARPAYSVLDTSKYESATGRGIRHYREPLIEYLARRARPEA